MLVIGATNAAAKKQYNSGVSLEFSWTSVFDHEAETKFKVVNVLMVG